MIYYQNENVGNSYECKIGVHENWYISPHIHEYSEFAFSKERETCIYVDKKRYMVPVNHLIYIRPNQVHEYSEETSSVLCCSVFSNDFNPLFSTLTFGSELENPVIDFSDHLDLLKEYENTDPCDIMKVCGLINLICDVVLKKGNWISTKKTERRQQGLRQIVDYISIHFREDIRLVDLAKKLGYHEKYLSSTLHSLTGMNFREFLATHRVNYAKKLLTNCTCNHLSISEIAMECGYSSIYTFNRMFLKLTGVTPSKFKKEKAISQHQNH